MEKLPNIKKILFFIILIFSVFSASHIAYSLLGGLLNSIEMTIYDYIVISSTDGKPGKEIVILAIDNESENSGEELGLGRWPWPRQTWAEVVDYISEGKPKSIVFDIRFEGSEGKSKENIKSDAKFTETLKKHNNVVLAILLSFKGEIDENLRDDLFLKIDDSEQSIVKDNITFQGSHPLYGEFIKNTNYVGPTNQVMEITDSIIRSHRPLYNVADAGYIPSLPLAAVLSTLKESEKKPLKLLNDRIIIGKRVIPIDERGKFLINWHGGIRTYKHIPVKDVLHKKISPEEFRDKIVVIGRTKDGTDIHATSVAMNFAGPEIIATCIDNILNDADTTNPYRKNFIKKAGVLSNALIILLFCLATGLFIRKASSNSYSLIWLIFVLFGYVLFALASFIYFRYWISITYPVIFITMTAISVYLYKLHISNAQRNQIKQLFGRFVSPQVFNKLIDDPSLISKEGDKKILTVLFSDIRGFTTLSEIIPPNVLVSQLNEYFNETYEIILSHNGTFDKYIGDAIMAFYGDPIVLENHALQAVLTAKEMLKAIERLNEKWINEHKIELSIGVGINTGEMIVGPVGAKRMINYTVMGDNVNIAARLESLNKEYKTNIIISESTYEQVKGFVDTVYLGEVEVKGKRTAIKIYKVY